MTETMNTHTRIGQTLTPQKSPTDAWVDLFESEASPLALLELLAVGAIPVESSEVAGRLRDAFVRRLTQAPLSQPSELSTTLNRDSPAFPHTLTPAWPQIDMENEKTRDYDAGAHLLGRLVAAAGGIGQNTPDALDVALKATWTPVVRQILTHFTPPATQLDSRYDTSKNRPIRDRWPWLHELTQEKRLAEIRDWLAVPGINPNVTCGYGTTALFHARNVEVLDALIEGGVDPSVQANNGMTAMADWEKKINSHRFTQATVSSMNERLMSTFSNKDDKIQSEVSQCLIQWLKPCDIFEKNEVGPDLENLSPELEAAMGTTQLHVSHSKHSQEWGAIAYMGTHLPYIRHSHSNISREQKELSAFLVKWQVFIDKVPEKWLSHESIPGVADGWVLATGLLNQAVSYTDSNSYYALKLFTQLRTRMMAIETPRNETEHSMNAIIRTYDALLMRAENSKAKKPLMRVLCGIANIDKNPYMSEIWGSSNVEGITRARCFIKGITLPEAGEHLLSSQRFLEVVTPFLNKVLIQKDALQTFWDTMLRFYSKTLVPSPTKEPNSETIRLRLAFNKAFESLHTAGRMPGHLNTPGIRRALVKVLPYIDSPALASELQAQMLDRIIPEKEELSRVRKRM